MIQFNDIPFTHQMANALSKLKIDYVFQGIFYPAGKTIYAREALMRPIGKTVTELIKEYTYKKELYTLEVATAFGASKEFLDRGYTGLLSINTFPCEAFSEEEHEAFVNYFGDKKASFILETLEYPTFDPVLCAVKRKHIALSDNLLALDDFGTGLNTAKIAEFMKPDIIKLDRSLLTNIDSDKSKQMNCYQIINAAHIQGTKIVAEGIETINEFSCMKQLGADFFQGYYLEMPK